MPLSTNILGSFLSFSSWVSQLWNHWRLGTRSSFLWRAVLHGRFFSSTCVLCLLDVACMPFSTSDNQKYLHMFLNILGRQKSLCENNRCPCENYFFRGICYPEASVFLPAEVNLFPIWVYIPAKQTVFFAWCFHGQCSSVHTFFPQHCFWDTARVVTEGLILWLFIYCRVLHRLNRWWVNFLFSLFFF